MSKDQLIQKIEFELRKNDDLQVTDKQRISIAKHIAKMPKKARIAFINMIIVTRLKSSEYDYGCGNDNEDYDPRTDFDDQLPDWNK